jgi:hypothetical protein
MQDITPSGAYQQPDALAGRTSRAGPARAAKRFATGAFACDASFRSCVKARAGAQTADFAVA